MQQAVRGFAARLAPEAVCDACIAERLRLGDLGQVARSTAALAGSAAFERIRGPCSLCARPGALIRSV